MQVGVYVDGFNLYFGGRSVNGRHTPGWRWLDVRSLSSDLVARQSGWGSAALVHIVYCTARISGSINPSGQVSQDVYIKALQAVGSVDHIEYGYYMATVKRGSSRYQEHQEQARYRDLTVARDGAGQLLDSGT